MNKKKELILYATSILMGVVCLGLIYNSRMPIFLKAAPTTHQITIDATNPLIESTGNPYYLNGISTVNTIEGSTRNFEYRYVKNDGGRHEMNTMNKAGNSFIANTEQIGSLLSLTLTDVQTSCDAGNNIYIRLYWGWHYFADDQFHAYGRNYYPDETLYPGEKFINVAPGTSFPTLTFDFDNEKPTYFYLTMANEGNVLSFATMTLTYKDDITGGCEPSPEVTPTVLDGDFVYRSVTGGYEFYAIRDGKQLTDIVVPSSVNGLDVVKISQSAFKNNTLVKSVVLPNTVKTIGDNAFSGATSLQSIVMPAVTEIGNNAFEGCVALHTAALPNTLTTVGNNAFNRTNLKTLHIPASLTNIGTFAFTGNPFDTITVDGGNIAYDSRVNCNMLVETSTDKVLVGSNSATIPEGIKRIDYHAFSGLQTLSSITIPKTLTDIGMYAFSNCRALSNVAFTLPSSLITIDVEAFSSCIALTSLVLPDCILNLHSNAFQDCTSLASVNIPTSVNVIGGGVFRRCHALTSIVLGNNITLIGSYAFAETSLTSLHIPANVQTIDYNAFVGNAKTLTSITVDASNTYFNDGGGKNVLLQSAPLEPYHTLVLGCVNSVVPDGVINIAHCAFMDCENLTSISLPNSLANLWESTFENCTSLTSIDLSNTAVTALCYKMFAGCTSLNSIVFPSGLTEIRGDCFNGCTSLQTIAIPNTVDTIMSSAFAGCSNLSAVTLPSGLTEIDIEVFKDCTALTGITIPSTVENIGDQAFANSGLTSIHIPAATINMGDFPFVGACNLATITVDNLNPVLDSRNNCNAIITTDDNMLVLGCKNTVIPNDVPVIYFGAFAGSGLTTFELPAHVLMVAPLAFAGCNDLTAFTVHASNPVYDARDNCNGLIETATNTLIEGFNITTIPNGVSLGMYAFTLSGLTNFVIPEGITYLPEFCFGMSYSLTSIKLPSTLKYIGMYAFYECTSLTSIVIPASVTAIMDTPFAECPNLTIYAEAPSCPAGWYELWNGEDNPVKWYSATPNYDGNHWYYVGNVPTIWVI